MRRRKVAAAEPTRPAADATEDAADAAAADADIAAALRMSRRLTRTSERLQECDQRPFLAVVEPRFFAEESRAEIVTLVDDQVLALADGQHVVHELRQRPPQILLIDLQLALEILHQLQQPLSVFAPF